MNYLSEEQLAVYCPADRFLSQFSEKEQGVIKSAISILENGFNSGLLIYSPQALKEYVRLKNAGLKRELFRVILLDAQRKLISDEVMFVGTISQTSVYTREVIKFALSKNASACILYHNHPSGLARPSKADELLTQSLKAAMQVFDIILLDHLISSDIDSFSMAESGII